MDNWFVGANGQKQGPLSLTDALAAVRAAGAGQTYVWREGFAEWKLASEVPEFAGRPTPPPYPASSPARTAPSTGLPAETQYPQKEGLGMSFGQAVTSCLRKYATFQGRASRSEYWFFVLFCMLAIFAGMVVQAVMNVGPGMGGGGAGITGTIGSLIFILVFLGLFLPALAVSVRRLHDIDKSGWWFLISFVPLVGEITLLVLHCLRGTTGPNSYGEDPLAA